MMSASFNLGLNVSTSQKLTPQMQQAIKLLQLSSIELEQQVQMKLDSNPLLERVEEDDISAEDFDSIEALTRIEQGDDSDYDPYAVSSTSNQDDGLGNDDFDDERNNPNEAIATVKVDSSASDIAKQLADQEPTVADNGLGELAIDTDWEDIYTHSPTGLGSPDVQQMTDYQGATAVSLQDHIRWQLTFSHLSDTDNLIADYLIDAMDESGFIQLDVAELKASFDEMADFYDWPAAIETAQIEAVIDLIQSCDPLGVGARSLAECLQIQLNALEEDVPYRDKAWRLLEAHELLVSNNIKQLLQQTGLKQADINPCLDLIRSLNPAPGLGFVKSQPNYAAAPEVYDIPDVIVQLQQDDSGANWVWKVALNPETLPKLRINKEYASLVKRGDDSADNVYLRDNLMDARLFIRSIEERNQNLLKVATCIVELQQDFLMQGATAMKPLILKQVADRVGLHESTVSRLTTSKSILTPQGLFSLKHFFSSHVSGENGNVSATAISAMIAELIEQEDPKKPLSDSAIVQHLQQQGIDIARRTVAKYREAMNIGSSTQRKRKF
ncbi:RNA polymerase factor sigma-54 [Psychrobacter sp. FDAARGOS_221]|uniref:RNA polymerase factor sigma-54 n=1 Tax=Psychrobacter sp. FDAARGOS_221 TaxID=1975705 RepID=UPI000C9F3DA5|nr:RNA polymerase factor sigma-54 [Psychrobacter sp. FDAARGOS_221]PNK60401.1 RNA polymerase sigma-54 factor [Psychrobacter sp. FDAARGOS_221]